MRAIALTKFGGVESFIETDWPVAEPKADEVRIRIQAVSFNPVDYKIRQGRFGGELPLILGHDVAGIIDQVGTSVTQFKAGDAVGAYLAGPQSNGGYAEYVCIHQAFVMRKPETLNWEQTAASMLVGLTAWEIIQKAQPRAGETAFIAGAAGGVGSMVTQMLRHAGIRKILATANNQTTADYLQQTLGFSANEIVFYPGKTVAQLSEMIQEKNHQHAVPLSIDLVGGDMKKLACEILDFGGRAVSIVEEPETFALNIFDGRSSPLFRRSASFHFAFLGARSLFGQSADWSYYQQGTHALYELLANKHIQPPQITNVGHFSAATVAKAHTLLEEGRTRGKLTMLIT